MKKLQLLPITLLSLITSLSRAQEVIPESYINPLDIDYTYMVYNSSKNISYRSGADPAVIEFRGEYYMFVTRSFGYWHSTANIFNCILSCIVRSSYSHFRYFICLKKWSQPAPACLVKRRKKEEGEMVRVHLLEPLLI